ncbi:hypothetical protein [Clostridium thermobutyricum]|uniref:hypothetical protein n=1 Tax=Clostridium thermobutyricum TaxID=29372 RepID=UPI003F526B91
MAKRHSCSGYGCFLVPIFLVLIFNILIGGWSIGEILNLGGINLNFYIRGLIGLFVAEFTIPIAFMIWVLRHLL